MQLRLNNYLHLEPKIQIIAFEQLSIWIIINELVEKDKLSGLTTYLSVIQVLKRTTHLFLML